MVVTGQYQPQSQDSAAQPLLELSPDAIRAAAVVQLVPLLDTLPGVYASHEGGAGGVSSLSIRGGEPNFSVVMVDGVALNDPNNTRGGSFDLSAAGVGEAAKIEIVRGPQSLVYGADALAGVVNIITAPSRNRTSLQFSADGGEFDQRGAAGSVHLVGYSQQLSLRALHRDAGKLQRGSSLTLDSAAADYRLQLPRSWVFAAGARRAEFEKTAYPEQSGGPELGRSDALDHSEGDDLSSYLRVAGDVSAFWQTQLSFSEFVRDSAYDSPGVEPQTTVPPNRAQSDYRRADWRWHNQFEIANWRADLGADRRRERGDSSGQVDFSNLPPEAALFLLGLPAPPVDSGTSVTLPEPLVLDTDYRLRRTTHGHYLQLIYETPAQIKLMAGWRRDRVSGNDANMTRRIALHMPLSDRAALWLARSEGFKSPSFFALGHALVGNPALRPERARSDELQLEWQLNDGWRTALAVYRTRYDDLIDFDAEQFTNVNRDRIYSRGAEIDIRWRGGDGFRVRGHVSYNDLEVVDSDRRLANRPRWRAGIVADYQITAPWSVQLRLRHVGRRDATSLHTGETTRHTLGDYTVGDAALHWQPARDWRTYVALDNVFDATYEEAVGFPGAGRALRIGVSWGIAAR